MPLNVFNKNTFSVFNARHIVKLNLDLDVSEWQVVGEKHTRSTFYFQLCNACSHLCIFMLVSVN